MKPRSLSVFCVTLLLLVASTPAQSTTSTTPGTGASTKTGADKPKALAATDKKFLNDALEAAYFELNLIEKVKNNGKLEATKKLAAQMGGDLNKIWGALAPIAQSYGEKVPTEITGGDKTKSERLGKVDADKFDKEFLKLLTKETQRMARTFESASKSAQDPALKQLAATWLPTVKGHDDEAEKAEKEAAKAK